LVFVGQKLNNSLLFDALQREWEQAIHFEQNTTHTTMFPKPHHLANCSSRSSEQLETSTTSRTHHPHKIHAWRHYIRNTVRTTAVWHI
jgi:hypothetical protein